MCGVIPSGLVLGLAHLRIIRVLKKLLNNILNNLVLRFRSSNSLNYWWTYRSSTAVYMVLQVFCRLILSIYVLLTVNLSYDIVLISSVDVVGYEVVRFVHANGCSVVFLLLFLHVGKGVWNSSYHKSHLWKSGMLLLILVIGAAFLGYVIPWGNISLWGATVITNLISVVPYGDWVLLNVWGGFTLNDATLGRMFSLHFLLPVVVLRLILLHLILLHEYNSSSVTGISIFMVQFSSVLNKDLKIWLLCMSRLFVVLFLPQFFIDADNWDPANFLVTPDHIKPEWYFLFAYAILRCIPIKWIRVLGLVGSLILVILMGVLNVIRFLLLFIINFLLLTYLGGVNVTDWYVVRSQIASGVYVLTT